MAAEVECPLCKGTGSVYWPDDCGVCRGEGSIPGVIPDTKAAEYLAAFEKTLEV